MTDEVSRPDPAGDPAVPRAVETPLPDAVAAPLPDAAEEPLHGAVKSPVGRRATRALFVLAFLIYVADLVTKVLAVRFIDPADPVSIVGDTVTLTLVRNPGAAFSMATGMTWLLTIVAIGVVIGVIKIGRTLQSRWWALGLGLVLGGALGNLIDRLFRSPGPLQRSRRRLRVGRMVAGVQRRRLRDRVRSDPPGRADPVRYRAERQQIHETDTTG